MLNKYRAAIIGCGNIGVFYSRPDETDGIMTHAHAYRNEPRVKLVAFVDSDKKKVEKAAKLWGVHGYDDMRGMFKEERIDIVSICVPDELHGEVIRRCLKYKPRAIFCEKPLTTNINSSEKIIDDCRQANVLLAVNFSRRWDSSVINLKKEIKKNKYGKVINVIGIYTKGILHNGSHLMDILRYFFGEPKEIIPLTGRIDWKPEDPTIDAFLMFSEKISAHLVGGDERKYSIFDLDILFEKARFNFQDFGRQLLVYKENKKMKTGNYKELGDCRIIKTDVRSSIFKAVGNLIDSLEGKRKLLCTGYDALLTQKACQNLMDIYKRKVVN